MPRPRANIPAPSARYGTWVCEQKLAATTSGISIRWSPHSTAHVASSTTIHIRSGRYGFHGWVSGTCPYPRTTTTSSAPTAATPFHPARRWPIHSAVAIARDVDRDGGRLQRPRRRSEHSVHRGEQVEAERSRVTPLLRILPDPPGQADQRRVRRAHVADAELGHRQVEDRVPPLATQRDHGDDQRQPDDQTTPPAPSSPGACSTGSAPAAVRSRGRDVSGAPDGRSGMAADEEARRSRFWRS